MVDTNTKNRILELIDILNKASKAYYNEDIEIMPNQKYDELYDELVRLEKESGIYLSTSPTQNVGYEVADSLPKVRHDKPMLSLDKTKSRDDIKEWLGDNIGVLSYKLDGLTIVLTYENGELIKGVTRGNGEIGEDVTNNVKNFDNVPLKIKDKSHIVLRGEAIITYSDFNKINDEIDDGFEKYKNPRNLCSGSVRQLDPKITKGRHVRLIAFSLVEYDGDEKINKTYTSQMGLLDSLGFDTVKRIVVDKNNIIETIDWYAKDVETSDNPSDGLVLMYDDIAYGISLGNTSKFPRNAIAFKWKDEIALTKLKNIEWSPSRTGLLNPVAVFDEVELEGTIVKRASLHNISIIENLGIGIGDTIKVYKANMIIPQVLESIEKGGKWSYPKKCPVCGGDTTLQNDDGVKTLHCKNEDCPIKHIKNFENFVSRNCMNIDGVSIATIETFIEKGFIKEYADLYKLKRYKNEIIELEGFGEKSYENIINAIDKTRSTELYRLINALGILGIGTANAKMLSKVYKNIDSFRKATIEELTTIDEIGPVLAKNIYDYFRNKKYIKILDDLLEEIDIIKEEKNNDKLVLDGMTFVITGSLETYANRDELVLEIEKYGGKATGSVSKNTTYLINNDLTSNSTKNKKAKELGVKIISEKMFKELLNG